MRNRWLCYGAVLTAFVAPVRLHGQDKPLNINGTFTTGYYSTGTRGQADQSLSFVPVGARFEMSGYVMSPKLLSFAAEPEVNLGPQASEAGFQGGDGFRLRMMLLRESISPVTFRYSNVQVEDVYFGSLTRVSGYTLKNRTKDIGLSWEFRPHNLPETMVDWGRGSVNSKSGIAEISDYQSHGEHINVDSKYERAGWDVEGFYHRQNQLSNLLEPLDGGANTTGSLKQTVSQYQGSARRGFFQDSEFYVDGGSQSTSSLLFTLPIDLTTHYAAANLRLMQKRRWKTSLRANYSSNLASQLLAQAANILGAPGAVAAGPDVLLPFSYGISNLNLSGITSVAVSRDWGLFASAERNAILSSSQNGPLNANYFTTSAGVTYAGSFHWGNLSGEYTREFGLGSITGQSGTIQGQNYVVSAQRGRSGGLVIDGRFHGTDQSVHNEQPLTNRSYSAEGSVADRVAGDLNARVGGGWQWGTLVNAANEYRTSGYTARVGIEHPRFQLGAALNDTDSNIQPFYNELLGGLGVGSILLTPLRLIPSDYRSMSFSLHANPLRKVELSAMWTRSRQHLDSILNNDFQLLNVYLTYRFRRIQLEAGFIRSNQIFAFYPYTLRRRFYVRATRTARLL